MEEQRMVITKSLRIAVFGAAVLTMTAANAGAADFINVWGWRTTEAIVNSATGGSPASLGLSTCHLGSTACTHGNADVTFTTSGVNFNASDATIATWIASNTPFAINNLVDNAPGSPMDATIWEF